MPREQLFDAVNRMVRDVREHMSKIGFWIECVELGCADKAVDCGGTLTSGIGAGKQKVLSSKSDSAQGALCRVVIDLNSAILAIAKERGPARERVTNRDRSVGLT